MHRHGRRWSHFSDRKAREFALTGLGQLLLPVLSWGHLSLLGGGLV